MSSDKVVIIIAKPADIHAVSVAAEVCTTFGAQAVILDAADYPSAWQLTTSVRADSGPSWRVRTKEWEVASEELAAVWWRRPNRHRIARAVKGSKVRSFCEDEARSAFQGWIYSLGQSVVNPLAAEMAANRKPFQLLKAREVGLKVPDTVITNDPREAQRFLDGRHKAAVFKVLTGTDWQFTETRRFHEEHLSHLESLRHAPVIFQELVEARCDIRANVIDDVVFAVSIKPLHEGARLDWRMDLASEIRPHDLPREIGHALVELLRSLGLRFGAIDLRLTPQNEYVFLEVNPGGQFLFCEIHAGQPISRTLAASLLEGRAT